MYVFAMDKTDCKNVLVSEMTDARRGRVTGEMGGLVVDTCSDAFLKEVEKSIRPSTVQVVNEMGKSRLSLGSGFFAGKGGTHHSEGSQDQVVTNAHVVAGHKALSIRMDTGEVFQARVVKLDDINDLALLKVQGLTAKEKRDLPLAPEGKSPVSREVMAIGHKNGSIDPVFSRGSLDGKGIRPFSTFFRPDVDQVDRYNFNSFLLRHPEHFQDVSEYLAAPKKSGNIAIWHGDSGGPVVDSNLNVTGVTQALGSVEESAAVLVPAQKVREFLETPDSKFLYRYEKKSEFDLYPSRVLIVDGLMSTLPMAAPRLGAIVWGAQSAWQMYESGSILQADKLHGSKAKYCRDIAEASIGIGGMALALTSKFKPIGMTMIGVKALWSVGGDFVKSKDSLVDVWRQDGQSREPLGWTSNKAF